jgi:GST-like protein
MEKLVLYASPMSSATPVTLALTELDVPHEFVHVDLTAGDQHKPAFVALNPNGKVPTLVIDGKPMFEALAILQWLGDRFGVERGTWPAADTRERFEALSWSTLLGRRGLRHALGRGLLRPSPGGLAACRHRRRAEVR